MTDRDIFIDTQRRLDGIEARLDTLESLHAPSQLAPCGFADPDIDVAPRLTDDAFFDIATGAPDAPRWHLDNPITPVALIAVAAVIGWALWSLLT